MKNILGVLGHLLALCVIFALWFPLARSFYEAVPTIGADFLQFSTYVAYVRDHLLITPASWRYSWYSGFPLVFDYSWLHYYLTLPLTSFLSAVNASRLYMIIAMFAQLFFSYLLLYEICRNRFVAMSLTIALAASVNFYHGLFDGGTATFTATRMFLPLTLFFLAKYFRSQKKKFLIWAGFSMGLSSLAHAGSLFLIILGPSLLFFVFWRDEKTPLLSVRKITGLILIVLVTLLIGGVSLYPIVEQILTRPGYSQFGLSTKVQEDALTGLFDRTNLFLFFLFGVFLLPFLVRRKFRGSPEILAFLALVFYILISCVLYVLGRHPLSQALGPPRIWWIFSLALAGLIALFWQAVCQKQEGKLFSMRNLLFFLSLLAFVPVFFSFQMPDFQEKLKKNTSQVGYPSNVQRAVINEDRETIEKTIIPDWMDAQNLNWRYYEINPGVETWWSSIFAMPLVKGYYNNLSAKANDWLYWVDNTILGEYVWHFGVPEDIAKQHALFLIDWYAIRYIETGGLPVADYLEKDPGIVETSVIVNAEKSEPLKPYKLTDQVISPIVRATNSPTVLMVGDVVGYDTFLKLLATENLNSRVLIPVHGPEYLEDLKDWDLSDFDAVFLYNYKYRNEQDFKKRPAEPWEKIGAYVKGGGRLIIETGAIESDSSVLAFRHLEQLPEVFPVETTKKEAAGENWNLNVVDSPLTNGVEFEKFSKLAYESTPWSLSYANGGARSWAKTVLSQDGKPILVEGNLGEGKVVWSGMNLPYHFVYYLNRSEALLFKNILGEMVSLVKEDDVKDVQIERSSPEKINISGRGFSGVVFKETFYPGWQGNLLAPQNKQLTVYRAGTYFMYIKIPKGSSGEIRASLFYKGAPMGWILFIISVATIILVLLGFIFEGILMRFGSSLTKKFGGKMGNWWEKEEE